MLDEPLGRRRSRADRYLCRTRVRARPSLPCLFRPLPDHGAHSGIALPRADCRIGHERAVAALVAVRERRDFQRSEFDRPTVRPERWVLCVPAPVSLVLGRLVTRSSAGPSHRHHHRPLSKRGPTIERTLSESGLSSDGAPVADPCPHGARASRRVLLRRQVRARLELERCRLGRLGCGIYSRSRSLASTDDPCGGQHDRVRLADVQRLPPDLGTTGGGRRDVGVRRARSRGDLPGVRPVAAGQPGAEHGRVALHRAQYRSHKGRIRAQLGQAADVRGQRGPERGRTQRQSQHAERAPVVGPQDCGVHLRQLAVAPWLLPDGRALDGSLRAGIGPQCRPHPRSYWHPRASSVGLAPQDVGQRAPRVHARLRGHSVARQCDDGRGAAELRYPRSAGAVDQRCAEGCPARRLLRRCCEHVRRSQHQAGRARLRDEEWRPVPDEPLQRQRGSPTDWILAARGVRHALS